MSIAQLRRDYRHAYKQWRLTRLRGWERAVARLNLEIMKACRR